MCSFKSNPLSEVNMFEKLKESHDDVLIVGPTGAGKGYLAERLHRESKGRADKKFIHVNSAAISSSLFESQMFGHLKGSFTGAYQNREGYCSAVGDGDLFLDEIGDLPPESQAKILVLINDRTFTPVGECEAKIFHGRIIAATNKNLKKEVAERRFREDLYYRLSTFVLNVKPLREQKEKIAELAAMFQTKENPNMTFDEPAMKYLTEQRWNGNVRQLKNVVKRIIRYSDSDKKIITAADIVPYIEEEMAAECEHGETPADDSLPTLIKTIFSKTNGSLEAMTKLFLEYAFKLNGRNITATAENTGTGRRTVERMLKKHGIPRTEPVAP